MNPDLEKLVRLQAAEDHLKQLDATIEVLPRQQAEADQELAREGEELEKAQRQLTECQQQRRQDETALQDLETRRSKYKGQLMEVKTNKEYQAMLHEIDGVEREIGTIEDRVLENMEIAEGLSATVKTEQGRFKEAEARHAEATRALDARRQALTAERKRAAAEREAVAATLQEDHLALFQRVARLRGTAVAEVRDGKCEQCRMALRPQMYVEVKHNDAVTQCPSCSRILFYAPPPPVVEAPPA